MRRLDFAVGAMAVGVAACGRIITEPKSSGNPLSIPSGDMYIRFRTLGTLDLTNLYYVVVFNTSGNGLEPYATAIQGSYTNYSFLLVFGGTALTGASYQLLQVISTGSSAGYTTRPVQINPLYVQNFNPNSNGTGNEFTFTFNRLLLLTVPNPLTGATPTPNPAATATPTPAPGSAPTISPGTSTLWALNFFSTDTHFDPIDAIANNGINDVSFTYTIDTTTAFDQPVNKPNPPPVQVTNTSAQIVAIEVINAP